MKHYSPTTDSGHSFSRFFLPGLSSCWFFHTWVASTLLFDVRVQGLNVGYS